MFSLQEIEALIQQAFLNGTQDYGNSSADYQRSIASFEFHCLLKAKNIHSEDLTYGYIKAPRFVYFPQDRNSIIRCEKIESLIEEAYKEGLAMGKINLLSDFRNSTAYQEFMNLAHIVSQAT